jgi:hypothetical protein
MPTEFDTIRDKIKTLNEEFDNSIEHLEHNNRELKQLLERSRYYIDLKIAEFKKNKDYDMALVLKKTLLDKIDEAL